VSFEFGGQRDSARWRGGWDVALGIGSLVPAFAWGVAFTDQVHGLPLSPSGLYLGGLPGLLTPVAVLGGLASLAMFTAHGAAFLSLKTAGPLAARAARGAAWLSPLAGALVVGTAAWLSAGGSHGPGALGGTVPVVLAVGCGLAFAVSGILVRAGRPGVAFGLSALGIVAAVAAVFTALFPRVMVSSGPGPALTVWSAASAHQTLLVMTVVAAIFVPVVLVYQGWSQRDQRADREHRSERVEPAGFRVARLPHQDHAGNHGCGGDRDVQPEDGAPGEVVEEKASDERAESDADR
jgi:cytochrome bd ubiquinol oxidase subunit II